MDRRTEPRFSIASRVKVTLLSSMDRQIDGRMVDLSATGMRFIAHEFIPPDEVIAIDFDDHLAVATVRHSRPYGDKFSVGTSRIHSLPKDQLPAGKPQYEQIRALLEEKGWLVEIETVPPTPDIPDALEPMPQAETAVLTEAAAVTQAVPIAEVAPDTADIPVADAVQVAEVPPAAPASAPRLVEPLKPLNATSLQRPVYQPPAANPRQALIAVGSIVLLIAVGGLVLRLRHQVGTRGTVAAASPEVSATLAEAAPTPPAPAPPAPSPGPDVRLPAEPVTIAKQTDPAPQPPASDVRSDVHKVRFAVPNPSWFSATADGKVVVAKMLAKGEFDEFEFSTIAFVHLGNGNGVEISVDGKPAPLTGGEAGPLRLVEITPDGARTRPWTNGDPPSRPSK